MRRTLVLVAVVAAAGCGGESDEDVPRRVTVPADDSTPPSATITLAATDGRRLGSASQPPGDRPPPALRLDTPRVRATTHGRDPNGGVARVRVSVKERVSCVRGGARSERPRTRYFPPPQIERIRSRPGARLYTERSRTLLLTLGKGPCGAGEAVAVEAEVWGEAINGGGLEAVTPHIRVEWVR